MPGGERATKLTLVPFSAENGQCGWIPHARHDGRAVCRLAVSGPLPRLGVKPMIDSQSLRIIVMNYISKYIALLLAGKLQARASTTT